MKDTPEGVEEIYASLLLKKTNEQRLKMGCSMFDLACATIKASFPDDLSITEKRQRLFLRLYDSDLEENIKRRVLERMQANSITQ